MCRLLILFWNFLFLVYSHLCLFKPLCSSLSPSAFLSCFQHHLPRGFYIWMYNFKTRSNLESIRNSNVERSVTGLCLTQAGSLNHLSCSQSVSRVILLSSSLFLKCSPFGRDRREDEVPFQQILSARQHNSHLLQPKLDRGAERDREADVCVLLTSPGPALPHPIWAQNGPGPMY